MQWRKLEDSLAAMRGAKGSQIVVTTHSKITARVAGPGHMYELKGLSEEDSWCLFKKEAFKEGHPESKLLGQQIVERCANVPLAIKVVGSLLYGQDEEVWQSFSESGIRRIGQHEAIKSILMRSYYHLESSLRICFSYCALFPKDHGLEKEMLISLWMAQGYIVPSDGQSIENAGEKYFSTLLNRCFFQDVVKNEYGEILSCKMHPLLHDIAQEVAEKEIYQTCSVTSDLDKNIRHLSHLTDGESTQSSFTKAKIRTYLSFGEGRLEHVDGLLKNWVCLRALGLSNSRIISLSDIMDKLLHLRYLDLSGNKDLSVLPKSFTKLYNLQTLRLRQCTNLRKLPEDLGKLVKLRLLDLNGSRIRSWPSTMGDLLHVMHLDLSRNNLLEVLPESIMKLQDLRTLSLRSCQELKELPKDLNKLVKLKVLDISDCLKLNRLPWVMGNLSFLQSLPTFVAGETDSSSNQDVVEQLKVLRGLTNFKGKFKIQIKIAKNATYTKQNGREEGYLRSKLNLNTVYIQFCGEGTRENQLFDYEEALLEDLQAHPNLEGLELFGYPSKRMPSWAQEGNLIASLPKLVRIHLCMCNGLEHLPSLAKMRYLKSLELVKLRDLEHIENHSFVGSSISESFSLSLEELVLEDLPKLKRWWRPSKLPSVGELALKHLQMLKRPWSSDQIVDSISEQGLLPYFPRLSQLSILKCPFLTCIPLCPNLESLKLGKCDERLRLMTNKCRNSKLSIVHTNNARCLNSVLPVDAFRSIRKMFIESDEEINSLSELEDVFQACSSSLRSLEISGCSNMKSLHMNREHLGSLESLSICKMDNLDFTNARDWLQKGSRDAWLGLSSLRFLVLDSLPKLQVPLPCGLGTLESLEIRDCEGLESLRPLGFCFILKQLKIQGCSASLKARCQKPNGGDWHNIEHILVKEIDGLKL